MKTINQTETIKIIGFELRTSNQEAFQTIPKFWGEIMGENRLNKIAPSVSETIYAVYTNFQNPGKNNEGVYSLIIGKEVLSHQKAFDGLAETIISPQKRAVFDVEKNHPEKVGAMWQEIWNTNLEKTFVSDFEIYKPTGEIEIHIGIK